MKPEFYIIERDGFNELEAVLRDSGIGFEIVSSDSNDPYSQYLSYIRAMKSKAVFWLPTYVVNTWMPESMTLGDCGVIYCKAFSQYFAFANYNYFGSRFDGNLQDQALYDLERYSCTVNAVLNWSKTTNVNRFIIPINYRSELTVAQEVEDCLLWIAAFSSVME
jgi:hypothetical protein